MEAPLERIERSVSLAIESGQPVGHVADDLGIHHETLRRAVRQAEADVALRPDLRTPVSASDRWGSTISVLAQGLLGRATRLAEICGL